MVSKDEIVMLYSGFSKLSKTHFPLLMDWEQIRKVTSKKTSLVDVAKEKTLPKGSIVFFRFYMRYPFLTIKSLVHLKSKNDSIACETFRVVKNSTIFQNF